MRDQYLAVEPAMRGRIAGGRLRWQEGVLDWTPARPDAVAGLYRGEHRGKRLIRLV